MESRIFSNRGIQQEDVWLAADSLIADGLRPTIERVRQKIGRGSPNTVSPMLETWFATLATRLGVNKQEDESEQVPKALQQALKVAWEIALTKGREEAALEVIQAQENLSRATRALQEREDELTQIEQVRAAKQQTLEETVNSARNSTEEARTRLSEAQQVASRRDVEIQNLHARLAAVETVRDSEIRRHQQVMADHLRERQKIEERAQSTEHRLFEEVDRARQEIEKMSSEAQTAGKQFSEEKFLLREKIQTYAKAQVKAEALYAAQSADLQSLQAAFSVSNSRSNEFQVLLVAQLDDSKDTVARLTEALLSREAGPAAGPKFLLSKFKRIRGIRKR